MNIKELNEELDKILETIYKDLDYTQSLAFDMYSKKDKDGKIVEYGYWKFPYGYNFYGYISKILRVSRYYYQHRWRNILKKYTKNTVDTVICPP